VHSRRTRITDERAEALLFPIAVFLRAGGMSKGAIIKRLSTTLDQAAGVVGGRSIQHIGHPMLYADVVGLWARDARFLDARGRPRSLPLRGKDGLGHLIRTIDPARNPRNVVDVLIRFGNVRKDRRGHYRLVQPLFFTCTSKAVAFEPMAYFLSDASATLGRILRRTTRTRGPELFWRKVESSGLSAASAKQFVGFVRERGQSFLEELDDWLQARAGSKGTGRNVRKSRRVGIGLFSIDSNADLTQSGS
jgi:hypothetical protein